MNIKDYIQDILDDMSHYRTKFKELTDVMNEIDREKEKTSLVHRIHVALNPREKAGNPGKYKESVGIPQLLFPNFLGAALGCAFARLFSLNVWGYIIFGFVSAVLVGAYKSHEYDKIAWKHAFIKNLIIMGICSVFVLIIVMLCIIIRKIILL
jgi:hypothetical protein